MKSEIDNYNTYNERMSASLIDKVFFVDKIPLDTKLIVDFGCADGILLAFAKQFFPNAKLVGYDNNEAMLQSARNKYPDITFYSDWKDVKLEKDQVSGKTVIIASSIIHEVYSYGTHEDSIKFWDQIYFSGFDYICIRDMMVSMSIDRPSDINDVVRVLRTYHRTKELMDFQANWGSIENNKNLIHFILKYKYTSPNWAREVKENYLPLYREDFMSNIPSNYDILFYEHFILPYLKEQVKSDMNIDVKDPTHIKVILKSVI